MKWFWQKNKQEKPIEHVAPTDADVLASIRYSVGENGDKYFHINDFIGLLTEYQKKCKDFNQMALLAQIITELKKA